MTKAEMAARMQEAFFALTGAINKPWNGWDRVVRAADLQNGIEKAIDALMGEGKKRRKKK